MDSVHFFSFPKPSFHPSMASSSTVSTTLDLHLTIRPKPRPIFFTSQRNSNNKRFTILCNSSSAPQSPPNPSLAEQLKPLSLNLLSEKPKPQLNLLSKPKSIWVNPSKPKRTVLNLQRHKRSVYSYNPQLKDIKLFCHKLNETDPSSESEFIASLEEIPHPPDRENALVILNSLKPWPKPIFFLNWLKTQNLFPIETIFYNVAMKSLRSAKQFELVEELAEEMVRNEVKFDNITYSTIITCAKRCYLFDKAVEWFEKMYKSGLMPDEVTYSAILDVYAKSGKVEEVMSLYERARASGWKPDSIAFSILGKMYGEAGDYDGIRFVLKEMKSVGVAPNVIVYNTLLEAMGKAGKPGLARSLFEEMVGSGLTPNEKTLTALVKIYGKARWGRDALELWSRMKMNGWRMDLMLYNTLLTMCAELGLENEAEELFEDMKNTRYSKPPDSWSYTAMLNIYGKGGNVDKAMKIFDEMAELGIKLNVMGCTCLIQCLGKANRIEDVVKVFEFAVERGVQPDDRLCGCLLSVVALCVKTEEVRMVLDLLEKSNPKLVSFIALISDKDVSFEVIKEEMKEMMNGAAVEVRRPFCNCLIDICRNRNLNERAHELLYLGTLYGLYPGMHSKTSEEWSLNLRSLSMGAAYTAFEEWMGSLSKIVDRDESLPALFSAHTGSGTHRFSQGLCSSFAAHVKKLDAPFRQSEENAGCFVATREDVMSWVQSRAPSASAVAV